MAANVKNKPEYIRVYNSSPIEGMWTYFRQLETVSDVSGIFNLHSDENAVAVRDCVRQAREYFSSARSAPLLTKPVLIYYGMVSLAKVILLLEGPPDMDMDRIEELERKGHGLKQYDPDPLIDGSGIYWLEEGSVEITADKSKNGPQPRGIFPYLAEAVNPGRAKTWLNQKISIRDLFCAIPQLHSIALHTFRGLRDCSGYSGISVKVVEGVDDKAWIIASGDNRAPALTAVEARKKAAYLSVHPTETPSHVSLYLEEKNSIGFQVSKSDVYSLTVREEFSPSGTVLSPSFAGERFDSILAQYVLSYALSIVARYKPHRWARILEGRDSTLLPLIENFTMFAERWWPNLVLNWLYKSWVCFGAPL